ncbi:hypothetical protein GCM10011519_18880 [Marmoricola endophyticus]|uniref:Transglycosylase SLT domain-containing protein n=1 Tax=Marmoricola endophyticus TaxID=2040280 RepID=A0A917BJB5_9ACTN|nr:lytic transglycosylase domain-containing protein [Marmoricola endophyticus]GGF45253.1 hypothetical protein GCM10011519_18880 [Marmoricola endophyticus]
MASKKLTRRQKAMTIVPLAIVCGVWTASLGGLGAATAVDAKIEPKLPDGASVPSEAIQAPANVSLPGVVAPGVPNGATDSVVDGASTSGIPSAALSAYQRGAQIIDSADTTCKIPWELIAAIGRVESDHGRYGGNVLSAQGVSTPGIYGIPLDGTNGTIKVPDTDAGQLDKDPVWDRAVGPMQFIPSTWSSVKVDADGDGQRNPQDIDDASLATAVYLCSGSDDLSTTAGQRASVYRYNHSQSYVDLVLRLMQAYSQGDYTAVPNSTTSGSLYSLTSEGGTTSFGSGSSKAGAKGGKAGKGATGGGSGKAGTPGTATAPGSSATSPSSPSSPAGPSGPKGPSDNPTKKAGDATKKAVENATNGLKKTVDDTISDLKAQSLCIGANKQIENFPKLLSQCVADLTVKTLSDATANARSVVGTLLEDVLGLGGILGRNS